MGELVVEELVIGEIVVGDYTSLMNLEMEDRANHANHCGVCDVHSSKSRPTVKDLRVSSKTDRPPQLLTFCSFYSQRCLLSTNASFWNTRGGTHSNSLEVVIRHKRSKTKQGRVELKVIFIENENLFYCVIWALRLVQLQICLIISNRDRNSFNCLSDTCPHSFNESIMHSSPWTWYEACAWV